jgi:proteasome alpha subunit
MVSINTQIVNKLFPLGVVLAAERKEHSKLFVPTKASGKLYKIDNHILASVSGIVADANYLIDYSRVHC